MTASNPLLIWLSQKYQSRWLLQILFWIDHRKKSKSRWLRQFLFWFGHRKDLKLNFKTNHFLEG